MPGNLEPFQTTLIIGLGGVGSRIVEGIYKKFMAANPTESDKRNVSFLCFDTDAGDIKKRQKVMPKDYVVKTSSDLNATVGDYIQNIQQNSTVLDWFDTRSKQVVNMSLNEGAAQIRMASRLAYMSSIQEGKMEAIDNCIKSMLAVDPERHAGNEIKIHIISSLAGGTGAGSFLQMAYYVKNAMIENNATAPKIIGYFILANVLCHDSSIGLSKAQKENCRSNTYACIKEQVAFSSSDRYKSIYPIDFEYKLNQSDVRLPNNIPYDDCYMIDYTGSNGSNLRLAKRYEEQVSLFVYLNAFSPIGDNHRSMAINDVLQLIKKDGAERYASFGISKLIYPKDDLFAYFSRRQVLRNMKETWLRMDDDFSEQLKDYKEKVAQGLPADAPNKGKEYMSMVEKMANDGSTEFRQIYNRTQIFDPKTGAQKGSKARAYLQAVCDYVTRTVNEASRLKVLYEECSTELINFLESNEETSDRNTIMRRETELADYRKEVKAFVKDIYRHTVRECFVTDYDNDNFISKDNAKANHHLNTYILEKEYEMHPISVRYFLYDVINLIKLKLAELVNENEKTKKSVDGYEKSYDDPDTDKIERAADSIPEVTGWRKVLNWITRQNPIRDAKEDYVNRSQQQCADIRKYSINKLLENTLSSLLNQIEHYLLEESEGFFSRLPYSLEQIQGQCNNLLEKHDGDDNPSVQYVLASAKIKQDIYEAVIEANSTPFFPEKMSASIYRSMFENTVKNLEVQGPATKRKVDEKKLEEAKLKENRKVMDKCIAFQEEYLKETYPQYAKMDVISALKEEAQWETQSNDRKEVFAYMKKKFDAFRDRAQIWGPNNLDEDVRHINAWGMHPICDPTFEDSHLYGDPALTQKEASELFGDTDVSTDSKKAASRLVSEFFNPNEIVRANAVALLAIDKNFKDFLKKERTTLANERVGEYFEAYQSVINQMKQPHSLAYSRHLDKRWHLPAFMPNIGSSMTVELRKFFKALVFGLLFDKFRTASEGGADYWKYKSSTIRWIKDMNGQRVQVGATQSGALNALLGKGLACNPDIVDEILIETASQWAAAVNQWHDNEYDESSELDLMKEIPIVKRIMEFSFSSFSFGKDKNNNWFSLLKANKNTLMYRLLENDEDKFKDMFFDDLIERLLGVFGPSENTYQLCRHIFGIIQDVDIKDVADARLREFKNNDRFNP